MTSLRGLRENIRKNTFVNRQTEIKKLLHLINNNHAPIKPIVNIFGIGGIGKSALLRQFANICKKEGIPYALIDGRDKRIKLGIVAGRVICNLPEALRIWAQQLTSALTSRKAFNELQSEINKFESILSKIYKSKEMPGAGASIASELASGLVSGTLGASIAGFPGILLGAAFGSISGAMVDHVGRTFPQLIGTGLKKDEVEFILAIEKRLADSFAKGINEMAKGTGQPVVLMIDTFEMIENFQEWLLNFFLETDVSDLVRLVIVGRSPLDLSLWHEWAPLLQSMELKALDSAAIREYMTLHGVNDERLIAKAKQISLGIPWALKLIVNKLSIADKDWGKHIEKGLQYEIAKRVVTRFLDEIEEQEERILVEACSLPLTFDEDLIAHVLSEEFPGHETWREMTKLSLFESLSTTGRLYMIDPAREIILDMLRIEKPYTLHQWNQRAIDYYRRVINSPETATEFLWEYMYHYFFGDPDAITIFLPKREFLDKLEVTVPSQDDIENIVEVDRLGMMTSDPEIVYTTDDILRYMEVDPSMFRIAIDRETGRIGGYTLVLAPTEEWCRSFEAGNDYEIHPISLRKMAEIGDFGDYLIDTIAVIDPHEHVTAALLMRHILPLIAIRPRKFYAMSVTPYGDAIVEKLQMNPLYTRYTAKGNPIKCFYFCLYSGQTASPLYDALEKFKPKVPLGVACRGCNIVQCSRHPRRQKKETESFQRNDHL